VSQDTEDLRRLQSETRTASFGRATSDLLLVPGLTVLYHTDLRRVGERAALSGLTAGRDAALSRVGPAFAAPGQAVARPLGDVYLSRTPLRLAPGERPGSLRLLRDGSRTPLAADGVPVEAERAISPEELERGVVLLLAERIVLLLSLIDPVGPGTLPRFGLVGESPALVRLRQEIRRVADLDVPVLLRGETGTGKELVASALHEAGSRRTRPYLAVNMAAIPPALAAAELFGAARGAFTGADRPRAGYFTRAQGGTLFLDEIGETPPEVQPLLLRALESREIQPVGGERPLTVDVRLVAATDADLEAAVADGRFRAPLLHRLSGYEILVPPLRARREDFGRLFVHFLTRELEATGEAGRLDLAAQDRPWIPAALVARLAAFDWPGNVRQLRNAVRQLVIAGRGAAEVELGPQLERLLGPTTPVSAATAPPSGPLPRPRKTYRRPEDVGDDEMLAVLQENRWRLQPTAARLGISRTALYQKIEKSPHIRKAADLDRDEIEQAFQAASGDLDGMAERLAVSKRGLQRQMKRLGVP
jgi:DNA-binding NtrC family response regulator